ncbi:MAG: tetratricopeptide repeat protein [Gemmatimonadetes bacterium]|nr:tetratricopeptide repeat protein [Gemmatimonadota bacterium]
MIEEHDSKTPRAAIARAEAAARSERWEEALTAYQDAVETARFHPEGAAAEADALRGAAIVRIRLGEWQEALRDLAESRLIAERMGDAGRLALADNARGALEFERGNWEEAERRYRAARESAGGVEDLSLLMEIENNEGALWAARGERARSEEHFRRALRHFEELERHPCGARAMNNLGMILMEDGRVAEADAFYGRALEECKRTGDLTLAATVMINRGRLALVIDEPIRAHAVAATAAEIAARLGNGPLAADAVCLQGAVARAGGRWDEARACLREALERSADGRVPLAEAETWTELAELELARERFDEAARALRQSRRCYLSLGSTAEAERLERRLAALEAPTMEVP